MKTMKRIVCVMCGVLALSLLFHAPTPVHASSYGQYGYSGRNTLGQYEFFTFDEDTPMLTSLNNIAGMFYTTIREQYTNSNFQWDGQTGSVLRPLDFYLSDGVIDYFNNLDLSNPEFLCNVVVYSSSILWNVGKPLFYFTKNNDYQLSYDSTEHKFDSKAFWALPDIVPDALSVPAIYTFSGGYYYPSTSQYNDDFYTLPTLTGYASYRWITDQYDLTNYFEEWLTTNNYGDSILLYPQLSGSTVNWYMMYGRAPEWSGFYVPIAIQSRLYKIQNGYSFSNKFSSGGHDHYCIYANNEDVLEDIPLYYYAEPFSTYINTPYATPTPIPVQPTRPVVLPTFEPFATPTPITGVVVPTYDTEDDTGSVISYALGNVTGEFIKPIYAMIVSVINYMFYNNIWFSFLVVAPSIAFIVFIIGRLRKK